MRNTLILFLFCCFGNVVLKKNRIRIGLLVPVENKGVEQQLSSAVERYNGETHRLLFDPVTITISSQDSYLTLQAVCKVLEEGVVALLALNTGKILDPISSVTSSLGVPLVLAGGSDWWPGLAISNSSEVNMAPHVEGVGKAVSDLIIELDMIGAGMFHYKKEDILLLTSLLDKIGFFHGGSRLYQIEKDEKSLKSQLLLAKQEGHKDLILLSCSRDQAGNFLRAALKTGLLETGQRLLLPCLGLRIEDLEDYEHMGATIMVLGIDMDKKKDLEVSLLADALSALETGITRVQDEGGSVLPVSLTCGGGGSWKEGSAITKHIKNISFVGQSGVVNIDQAGSRREFNLGLWQVRPGGWDRVGTWSSGDGMMMNGKLGSIDQLQMLINHTVVVSTILSSPHTMLKMDDDQQKWIGNERYEGFAVDLIKNIASIVKFNFTISITEGYGAEDDRTGEWDGMIGEILGERADMAIADLTITSERAEVVDFSMPFLNSGISILYVSNPSKTVDFFSFMRPLSLTVWLLVLVGGLTVSVCINIIARYSPFETQELGSNEGESPFLGVNNCIWFTVGSWMQQGCDFLPRAISTRLVVSFYWFFTLIMISSYTANLAAFLTIERMDMPISSVDDLAAQNRIKYGAVKGGSTAGFFQDMTKYKKMGRAMNQFEDTMVRSNAEGMQKVIMDEGKYAFFMESAAIEYHVERNCNLTQVGDLLNTNSYGVAFARGSRLRSKVSNAIIQLREDGVIAKLKAKWWKQERGGGMCAKEDSSADSVDELNLDNVGGIFLVLLIGLILGCVIAAAEVYWLRSKKVNNMI